jgi:Fic family protein
MRTYEQTHPWLSFELDLRGLDYTTWVEVGKATEGIAYMGKVPLTPEAAERLHRLYLAKGILATTAIEGNTLTEDEVLQHLNGELHLPPSREYLAQELDNIVEACNLIGNRVIEIGTYPLTPEIIREYNRLVLRELPLEEGIIPGAVRDYSVVVGRYRGAPAEDCEYLLERFCDWLNTIEYPDGMEDVYSILVAIAAHLYFVWIHPFGDGNGRTARLIEFRYLLKAGFPTPAAHLLSNFYNLTRAEYYRQLDAASRKGTMDDFINYAVRGLVDQLNEQMQVIRELHFDTVWRDFVYSHFRQHSAPHARQRRLVLDLSKVKENNGWVDVSSIAHLTPRLAEEYARKTRKTLSRDLNFLEKEHLIQRINGRVRANKDIILAFLPRKADLIEPVE